MKALFLTLALLFFSLPAHAEAAPPLAKASFAMGCFWCAEQAFENIDGVTDVVSGYEGGAKETATYDQVSRGDTGHLEAVEVAYDPAKTSYRKLLGVFWDNVDPFDDRGQFCDKGEQYTAVIFAADDAERKIALESLDALQARHPDRKVAVRILDAKPFYAAEEHHQNFAKNNKVHYGLYSASCGREKTLEKLRQE